MLIAFDVNLVSEYVLAAEAKDPSPTVFLTGVLDSALAAYLIDSSGKFIVDNSTTPPRADVKVNRSYRDREIVKFGLKGWRNFKQKDGSDASFLQAQVDVPGIGKRLALTDACLNQVKPWISELARKIEEDNTVTKDDEKNSSPSSNS